ncbi:MAG: hypothetical protein M3Z65_03185, partial [Chloroflexota bacterium]|nr:hypothetical protein [Chloroflexota bacterium]
MNVLARRPVQIIVGVVVALALFGGGFALGTSRAPAAATATGASGASGAFAGRGAGGAGNGGAAAAQRGVSNGQILAVNSDSITISVRAGGANGASPTTTTQLVLVGTGTRVVKTTETDVKL